MSVICPTITAFTVEEFEKQLNQVKNFAERIHLDLMDGQFAPTTSPALSEIWWPRKNVIDLHIMYLDPMSVLEDVINHHPHLVVVQAEADNIAAFVHELHEQRIEVGISLLQSTPPEVLHQFSSVIKHVLVFSGNLGHHGGHAELGLLDKVKHIKTMWPHLEIGWDGGISADNIRALADAGVDVLNTGGAIQNADDPQSAYMNLKQLLQS